MSSLARISVIAVFIVALASGCASGRVRGAQGTEMRQAEAYEPERKVDPPEGNISRETETYPLLEVDLERRRPAAGPGPEPEPQAGPQPEPKPEPGNSPE